MTRKHLLKFTLLLIMPPFYLFHYSKLNVAESTVFLFIYLALQKTATNISEINSFASYLYLTRGCGALQFKILFVKHNRVFARK